MTSLNFSPHATSRMSQRALRENDIELILEIGTDTGDGYVVCKKDVQRRVRMLKKEIAQAERLEGKRVVIEGDRVVTAYHATRHKQKHLLRRVD